MPATSRWPRARALTVLTGLVASLGWTPSTPASVAGPWAIMVYGEPLRERVVLANWSENLRLMTSLSRPGSLPPKSFGDRPFLHVAMFNGPDWSWVGSDTAAWRRIDPLFGNSQARYYPAYRGHGPVIVIAPTPTTWGAIPRWSSSLMHHVTPSGQTLLAAHGVPTTLE